MIDRQKIIDKLSGLYDTLHNKRTLTEYTANEGRTAAKQAMKLVDSFPDDNQVVIEIKAEATKMLKEAVAVADEYHSNYDYMNRKPKPGAPDPWKAVIGAQDATEYFIDAIVESYQK